MGPACLVHIFFVFIRVNLCPSVVQSDDGCRYLKLYEAFRLLSWMMMLPDTEYLIYKEKVATYEKGVLCYE